MQLIENQIFQSKTYPKNILVERQDQFFNISIADIIRIEAYGDYSKIYTSAYTYLSKNGMNSLEEKLDPEYFMRIHRSTIISKQALVSLSKLGKGFIAKLNDDSEVKVSKGYAKRSRI